MDNLSDVGGYMNNVLYEVCRNQPDHSRPLIVQGKLELIGRAYSAAPSRGVSMRSFYTRLSEHISLNADELDAVLDELRNSGRIGTHSVELAVKGHRVLNKLIVDFIRSNREEGNIRGTGHRDSFCSKYLHFHAPLAVPIYDSRVVGALRDRRKLRSYEKPKRNKGSTGAYASFCRSLVAYATAQHDHRTWTPRSVDGELWPYPVTNTLRSASLPR